MTLFQKLRAALKESDEDDPEPTAVYPPEVTPAGRALLTSTSAREEAPAELKPLAGSVMDRYLRARAKREMG